METTRHLLERLPDDLDMGPGSMRISAHIKGGKVERPLEIAKIRLHPDELEQLRLDDRQVDAAVEILEQIAQRIGIAGERTHLVVEYASHDHALRIPRLRWLDIVLQV